MYTYRKKSAQAAPQTGTTNHKVSSSSSAMRNMNAQIGNSTMLAYLKNRKPLVTRTAVETGTRKEEPSDSKEPIVPVIQCCGDKDKDKRMETDSEDERKDSTLPKDASTFVLFEKVLQQIKGVIKSSDFQHYGANQSEKYFRNSLLILNAGSSKEESKCMR